MTKPASSATSSLKRQLLANLLFFLPHVLMSKMAGFVASITWPWFKNPYNCLFAKRYGFNMAECLEPNPAAYANFQALFTRKLHPTARPIAPGDTVVVSPVDGTLTACGDVTTDTLLTIKGESLALEKLLGSPCKAAQFASFYLAPHNYHRVHMPLTGKLTAMHYIPGRLYTVNPAVTQYIPQVFLKNERLVCHFETALGEMTVTFIGALFVGGITTVWHGAVTPPHKGQVKSWHYDNKIHFNKGAELGYFTMGSTVVITLAQDFLPQKQNDTLVQVGQSLAF